MTRHATITKECVLALLAKPQNATMTQVQIGAAFGVTAQAAGNVLRSLLASGHVVATKDKVWATLYYALSGNHGSVVPPPYVNVWTKPLQGYDARMRAAMTMRSM